MKKQCILFLSLLVISLPASVLSYSTLESLIPKDIKTIEIILEELTPCYKWNDKNAKGKIYLHAFLGTECFNKLKSNYSIGNFKDIKFRYNTRRYPYTYLNQGYLVINNEIIGYFLNSFSDTCDTITRIRMLLNDKNDSNQTLITFRSAVACDCIMRLEWKEISKNEYFFIKGEPSKIISLKSLDSIFTEKKNIKYYKITRPDSPCEELLKDYYKKRKIMNKL